MQEDFVAFKDAFLEKYKGKQPPWGFGALSYITYKRTYARYIEEEDRTEEWWETLRRCIEGAQKIGAGYSTKEAERLYDLMFNLKCTFAGRPLWQLGTPTIEKLGGNSMLNCWFTCVDRIESFLFLFDNLMLGGGVGFSVQREHIHDLPKIKPNVSVVHEHTNDADFIVPDSREGWRELLKKTFEAYFVTGQSFTYSTILVRGYGERIKTFGGTASGPIILIEGVEDICKVLQARENKKLRSTDALDICNILGKIVVSGSVRRSAEIAIGDVDDTRFLKAKRWDLGTLPAWRSNSNNSLYCDDVDDLLPHYWDGFKGNGEAYGLININNCRKYARAGERKIDKTVEGVNPCGEVTLSNFECCNLQEIFLNNIEDQKELNDSAQLLYKAAKAICTLNFIHEETNKIVHKNMRIGIGVSGICQSVDKLEWLDSCYEKLRDYDEMWSDKKGYPTSIRLTTVKPSGTVSLLAGSTPGVHPGFSKHHIRRVRMASNDKLVEYCRDLGYEVEFEIKMDGSINHELSVVSFPCKFEEDAITEDQMSVVDQMNLVKKMQTVWADNAVSCTIYFEKDELPDIKEWLAENYKGSVKSISFCLKKDAGFVSQMPLEEIDEEKYHAILSKIKDIDHSENDIDENYENELALQECDSGACPIK